jgi:predicted nucleic acid-binding protein
MNADRVVYLDSSALMKLAIDEAESGALRSWLRRRRPMVSSALAKVELNRALLPAGRAALARGAVVLQRTSLIRVTNAVLDEAAGLPGVGVRSLDAIHLATARQFGDELNRIVTYDERMRASAEALGLPVVAPT